MLLSVVVLLCSSLVSCSTGRFERIKSGKQSIKIGVQSTTEQKICGHITADLITEYTDYRTKVIYYGSRSAVFGALQRDEVDIAFAYTGTMLTSFLSELTPKKKPPSQKELHSFCKEGMAKAYDIDVLDKFGFSSDYVLCVLPETANKYSLKRISDIKPYAKDLKYAGTQEWFFESHANQKLAKDYGLSFMQESVMAYGLLFDSLLFGEADCIAVYANDGNIKKYNLAALKDDQKVLLPRTLCPIMQNEFAVAFPEIQKALSMLGDKIPDKKIQEYNLVVENDMITVSEISGQILKSLGLTK